MSVSNPSPTCGMAVMFGIAATLVTGTLIAAAEVISSLKPSLTETAAALLTLGLAAAIPALSTRAGRGWRPNKGIHLD